MPTKNPLTEEQIQKRREYDRLRYERVRDPNTKRRYKKKEEMTEEERNTKNAKRRLYSRTHEGRLYYYKNNARASNREWGISDERAIELFYGTCVYCGIKGDPGGIDRLDNKKGYIEGNVSPCCRLHNKMKGNLTEREFREGILKAAAYMNQP